MKKAFTLILGVLAAGTMFTFAEGEEGEKKDGARRGGPGGPGGPGRGGPRRELTEEEKAKMQERRAAFEKAREQADANGNGKIDEDEREGFMNAIMLIRFDEDGDGKLNEAEQAKADEARKRFGNRRPGGRRPGGEGRRPGGRGGEGRPEGGRPGGRGEGKGKDKPDG